MTGYAYTFTPIVPFRGSPVFTFGQALTSSKVYSATSIPLVAPVAFTPAGTLPFTANAVSIAPLGFNFVFYGVQYSNVFVSGERQPAVLLPHPPHRTLTRWAAAVTPVSLPFIAFFFADLLPNAAPASRTYATIGTAPNRRFILRYSQVGLQSYISSQTLSCDVVLYEGTNAIELRYYQVPVFSTTSYYADVGVQGSAVGTTYDSLAIFNSLTVSLFSSPILNNSAYSIVPITPFVNPSVYAPIITPVTNTSKVYTATATPLSAPFVFTSDGHSALRRDHNGVTFVPLGFSFVFYGVQYSNIFVGSNGNIQFATASTVSSPFALGSSSNSGLTPFIAFFFADLLPNASPASRTYATTGSAPNRRFILRYTNVALQSYISDQTLSCDVLLYEGTNVIEFRYYQVPAFLSTSYYVDVGVQSAVNGSLYDSVSILSHVSTTVNVAVLLNGTAWFISPVVSFVNPPVYAPAITPTTTSKVYTAAVSPLPPPVAFTPAGILPYTDNDVSYVPLGFNFVFYGVQYSNAFVGANGNIQFSTASTTVNPYALGSSSNSGLSPFIAFFFADLLPSGSSNAVRSYATVGSAPNRQFILRYSNVPLQSYISTQNVTCDLVLYETTNAIEFRYYQVPVFSSTSYYLDIGIQGPANGTAYDSVAILSYVNLQLTTVVLLNSTAWVFTPITPFTNPRVYSSALIPTTSTSKVYTVTAATLPPPVAFTPAVTLPYDNDGIALASLGFNFVFYNVSYPTVAISSNGNLQFSTGSTTAFPSALGSSSNSGLSPFIAFFFADLVPSAVSNAVRSYATVGSAPNRQFILRYSNVPLQSYISTQNLTCDILLYEGTNAIEFRYYQVPVFSSTSYYVDVGIQNAVVNGTYDSVSLVSYQNFALNFALQLNSTAWVFTPLTPFTNSPVFTAGVLPTPVTNTSRFYTATLGAAPVPPVAFTPTAYLQLADDAVDAVQLGFNFTFYNVSYSTAFISTNGNIQFSTVSTSYVPSALGTNGNAALIPFIAFFYFDLRPTLAPATRSYATIGTAPNRQFILRYNSVPGPSTAVGLLNCDVVLNEGSNSIELRYYSVPYFTSTSTYVDIGIQNTIANNQYDSVSIINYSPISVFLAPNLANVAYIFTPIVSFASAPLFSPTPTPASSSSVYRASFSNGQLPSPPAFSPAGTLPVDDNGVVPVPVGFTFVFYGLSYTQLFVGANGDIQFQTEFQDYSPGTFGTGLATLSPIIAFFYTDLDPLLGGTRTYGVTGNAPNRQFILRYDSVALQTAISTQSLSCDVILTETSNTIEFRYYSVPLFSSVSSYVDIGIENGLGSSNTNDWISVVNQQSVSFFLRNGLTQSSYLFTPITPFVNAPAYGAVAPSILSASTVYSVTNSPVPALQDMGSSPFSLPALADNVARVELGFDFVFYGILYSSVFLGANGNIQFQTGSNAALPTTFEAVNKALGPFIAFFFTDLYPVTSASRSYSTIGQAPHRQLLIRYSAVPFQSFQTINAVTCDVLLSETSNTIEMRYYQVSPSPLSTYTMSVGLTNGTGQDFISIVDALPLSAGGAQGLQGNAYLFTPVSRFQANPPVYTPPLFSIVDNSTSYYAQFTPSVVPPISFTATLSPPLTASDDVADSGIPLGFSFTFYGQSYSTVAVSSNGDIQFQTASSTYTVGVFGTSDATLAPFIAFFWVDLYPTDAGSRTYGTIGTAPNRQWILRLSNVNYFSQRTSTFSGLTCDVLLSETTNTIEVRYYTVPVASNLVDIGLQNNNAGSTDWLAVNNDVVIDGLHAASLQGTTLTFYPAAACQPFCSVTPVATGSLCLLMYSLPGNIDYPFSIATSIQFIYNPTPITNAQGRAVTILSGSGQRTYTDKFGVSTTAQLNIAGLTTFGSDNLLYLQSSLPFDTNGITWNMSTPVQLPGAGPLSLSQLVNVYNDSGVLFEYGASRIDGLGSAWLSTVPGFMNVTIGPANLNALGPNYGSCQAPITFTNGLRPVIEPNSNNGARRFAYTYFVSDGATYTVQGNLVFTATSQFATTADLLGNNYQTIINITGTRTYTYLPTNQQVISQVTGLSSATFQYPDQRFYPYALLVSAPGVYKVDTAPFIDGDGVEFSITPSAPVTGARPGTGLQYSSISLYATAPEPNAVLVDGTYTNLPLYDLQRQTYAFIQN